MKTAAIFVGAGAAGLGQIGHILALQEARVKLDFITGTSSGAINGALLIQNNQTRMIDAWVNIRNNMVFECNPFTVAGAAFNARGLADDKSLRKFLAEYISKPMRTDMEFLVCATDEATRKPFQKLASELSNEQYLDMIWASCSIPVLFGPVKYEGRWLCDGGVTANAPIIEAVHAGAEVIYVSIPRRNKAEQTVGNAYQRCLNMITTLTESMVMREIKLVETMNSVEGKRVIEICVLQPKEETAAGLLDFDKLGSKSERLALIDSYKKEAAAQIQAFQTYLYPDPNCG